MKTGLANFEIMDEIKKCVNEEVPNGKFQLLRMYGAFERESERVEIEQKFRDKVKSNSTIIEDIVVLDNVSAICTIKSKHLSDTVRYQPVVIGNPFNIICDTFDEALIMSVCMKNGTEDAMKYIMKMIKE